MRSSQPSPTFLKELMSRFGGLDDEAPRKLPPVHLWNPAFCGHIDMRIARDGRWYYMGTTIDRPRMVKLFAGILRREPDDSYVLVTPVERVGIQVDDAPFVAVELSVTGRGDGQGHSPETGQRLAFRTNLDDVVPLDAAHPLRVAENPATGEPSPYILVRDRLEALISRPVYYELVALAEEKQVDGVTKLGLWSEGEFFVIGSVDAD
jgi:hypothetical protein